MDNDGDSWPCETVYGDRNAPARPGGGTHDCKALAAQGYAYDDVLTYWLALGSPKDMDDDGDGWPCETVYGEQGTRQCDPN
jgi:hypothetical protein